MNQIQALPQLVVYKLVVLFQLKEQIFFFILHLLQPDCPLKGAEPQLEVIDLNDGAAGDQIDQNQQILVNEVQHVLDIHLQLDLLAETNVARVQQRMPDALTQSNAGNIIKEGVFDNLRLRFEAGQNLLNLELEQGLPVLLEIGGLVLVDIL